MDAIFLRDTAGHPERQDNNILPARITNHCIVFGSSWLLTKPGGGGHSLIRAIRERAAGQGMVFWPRCPKQGIQFDLPLS